jgi:HEAT repeat protein
LQSHNGDKEILFVLEQLGKLPPEFDASLLLPLVQHPNDDIRLAAVKNVGKLKDASLLEPLTHIVRRETNTLVRREMVSAIGRRAEC